MNLPDSNTPSMEVGQRLRELREQRRVSMRQLGRLSGISVNALSQIERGQTSPSVSTLYRLVDALGVPITAIFPAEPQQDLPPVCVIAGGILEILSPMPLLCFPGLKISKTRSDFISRPGNKTALARQPERSLVLSARVASLIGNL